MNLAGAAGSALALRRLLAEERSTQQKHVYTAISTNHDPSMLVEEKRAIRSSSVDPAALKDRTESRKKSFQVKK